MREIQGEDLSSKQDNLSDLDQDDYEVPDYDKTIKIFKDGDIISGVIVRVDKDEVLLDVGYKSEGVIPVKELSIRSDLPPHEIVKVGDCIEALVLQKEDSEGRLLLSKKRAQFEKAWKVIEEKAAKSETITGKVLEVVKGGLILDIGLRGFLPASLVDIRRVKDLVGFIGQELDCKVIEVNRSRNNVVLSRKAVLQEGKFAQKEKILSELSVGQIISGCVSNLVNFGAFVDLDGIDGLIHISELSWEHVSHPSEVLSVGDDVEVKVLDIDKEKERISLGLKQTKPDPWQQKVNDISVGDIVDGRITKIVPFGAFIKIGDDIEGLTHITELSDYQSNGKVKAGDDVKAKVIDIDFDRHRISLSIRQAADDEIWEKKDEVSSLALSEEVFPQVDLKTVDDEPDILESDGGLAVTAGLSEKESLNKVVADMKAESVISEDESEEEIDLTGLGDQEDTVPASPPA